MEKQVHQMTVDQGSTEDPDTGTANPETPSVS
jgi:hypothetical protein